MPIVDPQSSAEMMARMEAAFAARSDAPGVDGSMSRAFPVSKAFQLWFIAEVERGTSPTHIAEATARILAAHMSTIAASIADGEPKDVCEHLAKMTFVYALDDIDHGVMGEVDVYAGMHS